MSSVLAFGAIEIREVFFPYHFQKIKESFSKTLQCPHNRAIPIHGRAPMGIYLAFKDRGWSRNFWVSWYIGRDSESLVEEVKNKNKALALT